MDANSNSTKRKYENPMPVTDESWWESVLAEERQYAQPRSPQGAVKPKTVAQAQAQAELVPAVPASQTDWTAVKELYSNDRIVELTVSGHNRGGLLVEKDGLSGFIPFSHLIELAGKEQETDRDMSLETYVGKTLRVKVIECVPEEGRVVFSERAALAEPGKRGTLYPASNRLTGERLRHQHHGLWRLCRSGRRGRVDPYIRVIVGTCFTPESNRQVG